MAEKLSINSLCYRYALGRTEVLRNVDLSVKEGEKILLSGRSGSGKSTLLKLISPVTAPRGDISGQIMLDGKDVRSVERKELISRIAYVQQNPDTQIVVDTVLGELMFGCENIGVNREEIRRRTAWTATYFGIEPLLKRKTAELSGGQKQIVSIAAAFMLKPDVLLLDEPTTYLDPVAAVRFFDLIDRLNRDFGVTVIVSEHRVEEFAKRFDRIVTIEDGKLTEASAESGLPGEDVFYERLFALNKGKNKDGEAALCVKDLCFRYGRNDANVLDGADINIRKGEVFALLGGNGSGKTTFLRCLTGELKPQRGKISASGRCAAMTQNPLSMFIEETPRKDLTGFLKLRGVKGKEAEGAVAEIAGRLSISDDVLDANVLDISGGEIEKAAVAKLLLAGTDIMLFDEPTKGLDREAKKSLAGVMRNLAKNESTVVFVTHDVNFALAAADRAGVLSGGMIIE